MNYNLEHEGVIVNNKPYQTREEAKREQSLIIMNYGYKPRIVPRETFSEKKGVQPFDWNKALTNPNKTEEDWDDMYERASDWVTCACGNACAIIPRNGYGMPLDVKLNTLGYRFYNKIASLKELDALGVLDAIEKRSAEIIAEIVSRGTSEA